MTNKYSGKCNCGRRVAPRRGTLYLSDRGGWYVRCAQCAPGPATVAAQLSPVDPFNLDRDYEDRCAETCGLR